jgi:RNA polymerase subunit RPABC4/transcription elongation factor Spt4
MACHRCKFTSKLCYSCLSNLAASQTEMILKMQQVAAEIYSKMEVDSMGKYATTTSMDIWRQVEEKHNMRIRT